MASNAATTRFAGGNVALPVLIQRELGIQDGDALDASVENGRIVLTPKPKKKFKGKIITDPRTGLPVLTFGPDAPMLADQ